jgi:hypothetical protein
MRAIVAGLLTMACSAGGDGGSGLLEQEPLGTAAYGGACTHKARSHVRFWANRTFEPDIAG